ncbi:MAG: hypothetical protein JW969_10490, partial [Spirochaetales bacterium]|nr:hypothetical protein [Spirochaetales bacterium]
KDIVFYDDLNKPAKSKFQAIFLNTLNDSDALVVLVDENTGQQGCMVYNLNMKNQSWYLQSFSSISDN